ncbi:hypothetical protein AGLY_001081 [Aphis glycines]|uniref:Uncharacterized protein n=1 Tax=Aphis glycines TaxID=307491 RepID=A0A6G0U8T7_APHGL|nr:hypothetical protein AGLY_001081 [Aphis glycines]
MIIICLKIHDKKKDMARLDTKLLEMSNEIIKGQNLIFYVYRIYLFIFDTSKLCSPGTLASKILCLSRLIVLQRLTSMLNRLNRLTGKFKRLTNNLSRTLEIKINIFRRYHYFSSEKRTFNNSIIFQCLFKSETSKKLQQMHKKSRQVGTALLYIRGWGGPRTRVDINTNNFMNFELQNNLQIFMILTNFCRNLNFKC